MGQRFSWSWHAREAAASSCPQRSHRPNRGATGLRCHMDRWLTLPLWQSLCKTSHPTQGHGLHHNLQTLPTTSGRKGPEVKFSARPVQRCLKGETKLNFRKINGGVHTLSCSLRFKSTILSEKKKKRKYDCNGRCKRSLRTVVVTVECVRFCFSKTIMRDFSIPLSDAY